MHSFTRTTRRLAGLVLALGLALAALFMSDVAAYASGTPVPATVSIGSTFTFSVAGCSGPAAPAAIDFGSPAPGSVAPTAYVFNGSNQMFSANPTCIATSVTTNSATGYAITAASTDFTAGSNILAKNLSVEDAPPGGGQYTSIGFNSPTQLTGPNVPVTLVTSTGPSTGNGGSGNTDEWVSAWNLAVPANAVAGTATATVTYTALVN